METVVIDDAHGRLARDGAQPGGPSGSNRLEAVPTWLTDAETAPGRPISDDALVALYGGSRSFLQNGRHHDFDRLLDHADPAEMAPEAMVGLLRYSFSGRHALNGWHRFRGRVAVELARRGIDHGTVLRGLDAGCDRQAV